MLPLIAERRSDIAALCRRFGVRRLVVFGSAARGADFDPARSDLDFLVEFDRGDPDALSLKTFFETGIARGAVWPERRPRRAGRDAQSLFEGEHRAVAGTRL